MATNVVLGDSGEEVFSSPSFFDALNYCQDLGDGGYNLIRNESPILVVVSNGKIVQISARD